MKKIKLPEISWRIQNLIPISGLVILAAISGEKKTWVALEMARCIALGENFLGQSKFKTQAGNVLYIDMEMPKTEMIRRGKQLGLSEGENKLFILNHDDLSLYGYGDDVDENKKWFVNFIVENNISVVFIDTFRAVAGGLKEEKAEEIRKFFNFFKPLKHLGVTAVFLDHLRKPTRWEKVPKKNICFRVKTKQLMWKSY